MTAPHPTLLPLEDERCEERALVGGKAAVLARLRRAGFAVPPGWVLTTAVAEGDGAAAIAELAALVGDVPVAVRSSAVAEDGDGASFAGQFESVLGVRGAEALEAAVRRCWASARAPHLAAYGGAPGGHAMAVLVMPMLEPKAAGVAFSAHPVSGARDEVVIDAVAGLADRLVAGERSGEQWVVGRDGARHVQEGAGAIDAALAARIAALARSLEGALGAPQDVEWAVDDAGLWVLQSRPITRLGAPPPARPTVVPPSGHWLRSADHAPLPHSPFNRSTYLPGVNACQDEVFATAVPLIERLELREIGGWEYVRLVPYGGGKLPPPPAWLVPLLWRAVPSLRRRVKAAIGAVRNGRADATIATYYREWRPDFQRRLAEMRARGGAVAADASDGPLVAHLRAAADLLAEGLRLHFHCHVAEMLAIGGFAVVAGELIGAGETETLDFFVGLSQASTEPAKSLAALAAAARERPAVRALFEGGARPAVADVRAADDDFRLAFDAHQERFGHRSLRLDVMERTLAEVPEVTVGLLHDQLRRAFEPERVADAQRATRARARAEAEARLARRTPADRERFFRALEGAERAYPLREDNEFWFVGCTMALLRYAALAVGARLAERGQIGRQDDVFFLEIQEAIRALASRERQAALVAERREAHREVQRHPGPPSYGVDPGRPESFDGFPPEVGYTMRALLWYADRAIGAASPSVGDENGLRGVAASAGRYTGPVKVIRDEGEFDRIAAGDVLVCPITSPVWSVIFPSIGALVTDSGAVLSHPSIIAREFGIPAVVGTGNATSVLRDGQVVTVDGTRGVVERLGEGGRERLP
ncbi:MAG TPA: PEP/pyruvate-binding domain-containing protein [Polyangiaceae bacterium]|nr:PEP/pyruvate-binding domain-containing protein [Polyangiaceae bacterium]